jgi:hypothetical protein
MCVRPFSANNLPQSRGRTTIAETVSTAADAGIDKVLKNEEGVNGAAGESTPSPASGVSGLDKETSVSSKK